MARRSHFRPPNIRQQFQALARFLPMAAGSLVEQYVTCGKPRCRCTRGQKHGPLDYLYWKEPGRSRSLYVPREKVGELRRQIQNYRRFQAELSRLRRRQLRRVAAEDSGGALTMMGQQPRMESLFYYFRLEDQIPEDHRCGCDPFRTNSRSRQVRFL